MDIIIVGMGKLGAGLAKRLTEEDHNVTIIDINMSRVDKIVDKIDVQGVYGSGTHIDVLNDAGVSHTQLLIAATLSDENNILTCLIAKRLGAKHTIARVRNPEYNTQFDFMRRELGVSVMVNPDYTAAMEVSRMLQFPDALGVEAFANGYIDIAAFRVSDSSPLAGMKVTDVLTKYRIKMIICAVEHNGEVHIPNGDYTLMSHDKVYITGEHDSLAAISKKIIGNKAHTIKNIMIIGASRVSIYLSKLLIEMGKNVVIVENNREKCKKLVDMVSGITVINGDANDHEILIENNIAQMDAVVTLTNTDEVNFLVSLYAKNLGVKKTITKINNSNLQRMLDDIGLDSRVNVGEISVDMITQYVRAKEDAGSSYMTTLYKLLEGRIEAAEFIAGDHTKFIGRKLSDIKIKKDIIIAAINRRGETIFPTGNDAVEKGDIVVVVSKGRKMIGLNDILQ